MKFKKSQLKTLMITLFLLIAMSFLSFGAITITQNAPSNGSWVNNATTNFEFTPIVADFGASAIIDWCAILTNDNNTVTANYTNVPNGTLFSRGVGLGDKTGLVYNWSVICDNGSDEFGIGGRDMVFGVDSTLPAVTLLTPDSGTYLSSNRSNLTARVVDTTNLEDCVIFTNVSSVWTADRNFSVLTSGDIYGTNLNASEASDGVFVWNMFCNQTSTEGAWASSNYTFTIDSIAPTAFDFTITNNTFSNDSTPTIKWSQTTEANFDEYFVRVATDSNFATLVQTESISNRTNNFTTLDNLENDGTYFILITAIDLAGSRTNSTNVSTFNLDSTYPSVTLVSPTNNTYSSGSTVDFNVTVVDVNPSECVLYLSNSTRGDFGVNLTTPDVTNGSVTNLTVGGMNDGNYTYNIGCNDSYGNTVNVSSTLLDLTVDTTAPSTPTLTLTFGQTNSTDRTPTVSWLQNTDDNFNKYVVEAWNLTPSLIQQINVSSVSNISVNMSLDADFSYIFNVTAYDLAGNVARDGNLTVDSLTYIDPICGTLYAGWNACGIVSSTLRNLSVIAAEASATMVAVWNTTHQWQTCVYGISETNCNYDVGANALNTSAVWVYVASETRWEDRVWSATAASANITLVNTTSGWNYFGMSVRGGLTFLALNQTSRLSNDNVTGYSLVYNNGTNAIPYITIDPYSIMNSGTQVDYGRALWVNANSSSVTYDVGGW